MYCVGGDAYVLCFKDKENAQENAGNILPVHNGV